MRFDHVGVVARKIETGRRHFESLFGISKWTNVFEDSVNGVYVQFGIDASNICYELIAPWGEDSPVNPALKTGRRILNHVAYLVTDLDARADHFISLGCTPAAEPKPAVAYNGRRIQFFITPMNFIVELIEAPDHRHSYLPG